MDPSAAPMWRILGSLWPFIVVIAALLWFTGTLGGLVGIVAHGVQAVMAFGMNFLARTLALGAVLGLVLLAAIVFRSIGAPAINTYFPATANNPASVVQPAAPPPAAPAGG